MATFSACTSIVYNAGQMWHWALEKPTAALPAHESETNYAYRLRDLEKDNACYLVSTYGSKYRLLQIGAEDGRMNISLLYRRKVTTGHLVKFSVIAEM